MANQPAASFARPATAEQGEEWAEVQEEAADLARKQASDRAHYNKVASFLGQKTWRVDRTWPFLYWRHGGWQSRVELYFPALNLAVDRYLRPTSMDRQEAAFKADAFKAHGVRYKALFPESKLADLKGAL